MDSQNVVGKILSENELEVVGSIVTETESENTFIAFIRITKDQAGHQIPSNRKLEQVRELVAVCGVRIEFILRDESLQDVEAGLRATLLHSHISAIKNVYMTVSDGRAHIWLEPKIELNAQLLSEISTRTEKYLSALDIAVGSFHATNDTAESIPTKFVILRHLRNMSPAVLGEILQRLEESGFSIPSRDWLRRRLESLRAGGMLIWQQGGYYIPTALSLHVLGTSKNRQSPDISRLLALAHGRD